MARHYSPPGTWESIRKSVLEDPSLTDAEFRLALYLVTKQAGWVIHPEQLAEALDRSQHWVDAALRGLRRRGLVELEETRTADGRQVASRKRRFRADLILAPPKPQVSPGAEDETAGQLSNGRIRI